MRCGCGNERPFLVRGVCEVCLPGLAPIKITKHGASRKGRYVVRITKDWFYDGGQVASNKSRLPARRTRRYAKRFVSLGPAKKVAALYGGTVEEVK